MRMDFQQKQQLHSRRPAKGSLSHCLRKTLRFLNYFIILCSVVSIAVIIGIRLNPTWAGWGFIAVGMITLISGILGCFTFDSCFSYHFLAIGLSMGALGSASLGLFIKQQVVERHLKSKRSYSHARVLMRMDAVLFMMMLCVQMIVLIMAFVVHHCSYVNYYEDLEAKNEKRGVDLAKVQEESNTRAAKAHDSQAAELNKKMRDKYGKFTDDAEFAAPEKKPSS